MWQSLLDRDALIARAQLLSNIRKFFASRKIIEVDVPAIGASTVTDVHLCALDLDVNGSPYYLQTSPEFFMKRLLAGGSGSIYSLAKAFRNDEVSKRHNPEFTMLEWYHQGYTDKELIEEVIELIQCLKPGECVDRVSYGEIFERKVGIDPHYATAEQLEKVAAEQLNVHWQGDDKSTWLDLLFSHQVEPHLKKPTVVYDYPACQCALARVTENQQGVPVAKRFELFWCGLELANGYWELTDAEEQFKRFQQDVTSRKSLGRKEVKIDSKFMAALESGLPECAGVALGVDRLFMCLQGQQSIDQTIAFAFEHL
ncbi:EF-P lysine aminoacylase EpmA [Agarilytica rhodophyticola]|uniref:EF-P lysine aminoacylase EpmA n=1 Tax=Agarilytica rhodophyticola TaxID=1737490 RepID=UPI000B3429B3|nr:EF-P lysine aminoacylase EpmA [Agarilytica rhodophyticola]